MCVYRYRIIITSQRIIPLGLLLCKNSPFLFSIPSFSNSDHYVSSLVKKIVIDDLSIRAMLQRQSSSMQEGFLWQAFGCWCIQVRFPRKNSRHYTTKSLLLHSLKCEWTAIGSNLTGSQARKVLGFLYHFVSRTGVCSVIQEPKKDLQCCFKCFTLSKASS